MNRILTLSMMTTFLFTFGRSADGAFFDVKENCDVPGESLQIINSLSQKECQRSCDNEKNCKGFVYITGWKRCLLKDQMNKQVKLQLISGELDENRKFDGGRLKFDSDHTGKDLERKVLDQADLCAEACISRADCQAFTFLEGYRVCWLKAGGGQLKEKTFRCATKKSS